MYLHIRDGFLEIYFWKKILKIYISATHVTNTFGLYLGVYLLSETPVSATELFSLPHILWQFLLCSLQ